MTSMALAKYHDSLYYECLIEYASTKIWLQSDPLTWLKRITETRQWFIPSGNLAQKTWLCFFLMQLHINRRRAENGSKVFYNPKEFWRAFNKISSLFPFSKIEMDTMRGKIREWTLKTHITVYNCQKMVNIMKKFLQPIYKKLANTQAIEGYRIYQGKLNSTEVHLPTASTLKSVFLWMYDGSIEQANKEWKDITNDRHPDVIQLKKRLAKKSAAVYRNKDTTSSANVLDTLPGCVRSLRDVKKSTACTKFTTNSERGKEKQVNRNMKLTNAISSKQKLRGSDSANEDHMNCQASIIFESSEDVIDPSSQEDHNANLVTIQKNKCLQKLPLIKGHHNKENEQKAHHLEKNGIMGDRIRKPRDYNNKNAKVVRHVKKTLATTHDSDSDSGENELKEYQCHSPKTGISRKGGKKSNRIGRSGHRGTRKPETNTGYSHSSGDSDPENDVPGPSKWNPKYGETSKQNKANDVVQTTKVLTHTLSNARKDLMDIVQDPYENANENSAEDSEIEPRKKKKSKWIAPQKNAAVLTWSSSDDELDNEPRKIELPPTCNPKDSLLDFNTRKRIATGKSPLVQKYVKKRKRYWTIEEMDWIREGVKVYGVGNWAIILANYPFVERSSVDIKDKYRNMLKHAEI